MKDIVIEIRGGVVVEIYSDLPDVNLILVDWDNIQEGVDPSCWGAAVSLSLMPEDTFSRYRDALRRDETEEPAPGSL